MGNIKRIRDYMQQAIVIESPLGATHPDIEHWRRGQTKFSALSIDELRLMMPPVREDHHPLLQQKEMPDETLIDSEDRKIVESLPTHFDWREKEPRCKSDV